MTDRLTDEDLARIEGMLKEAPIRSFVLLLAEIRASRAEIAGLRSRLEKAADDDWTAPGLDKLNTFARSELLPEMHRSEDLPEQIDNIVFHFKGLARKAGDEVLFLRAERDELKARLEKDGA